MSKVICDVCGTSYPDTATQCPICGCVRPADARSVSGNASDGKSSAGTYTYVKGGRFSKANVRKRNSSGNSRSTTAAKATEKAQSSRTNSNKGLIITAVLLLLAIVAVVIYIALRFFFPVFGNVGQPGNTSTTDSLQQSNISCKEITLGTLAISFDQAGQTQVLNVTVSPADTTDAIVFSSSDEAVATVGNDGKITAVGNGRAIIKVTCGRVTAECVVECKIEESKTTEPTIPTTTSPTEPTTDPTEPETTVGTVEEFRLNRKDITFRNKDESWMLYDGSLAVSSITWSSDNESVATIKNGRVVAVGEGVTTVYGEYNGNKVGCIIRCSFDTPDPSEGEGGIGGNVTEDGGGSTGNTYKVYTGYGNEATEAAINPNETFTLHLKNQNGEEVAVTWVSSDSSICSVSGKTVTGVASGKATISTTYQGVTYTITVYVR